MKPLETLRAWSVACVLSLAPVLAQGESDPATAAPEGPVALAPTATTDPVVFERLLQTQTRERLAALADAWLSRLQEEAEKRALDAEHDVPRTLERAAAVVDALEEAGGDADVVLAHQKYLSQVGGDAFSDPSALLTKAKDWLLDPAGGLQWAFNLLLFIVTLIAFRIIGRIVGGIIRRALRTFRSGSQLLQDFFVQTTTKLISFVGLVMALSFLGVPTGPFVAALGAAGFIIGFALQGTLNNFAAGIMILLYRPYDIGDFVQISGVSGSVRAMSLVSTTLATPDNQVVVVPNGSIWGDVITNVTGNAERRIDLVFGISYGDDMDLAKGILEKVVKDHPKVLAEPAPLVQVHELADSSVNLVCRPWCKTPDYWTVRWDLMKAAKQAFDAADVTIPFPQRDVHVFQAAGAVRGAAE